MELERRLGSVRGLASGLDGEELEKQLERAGVRLFP